MAVIEYMMHRANDGKKKEIPGFIGDRGHHFNSLDNTYIGWVNDERDYYVPDSIVFLSKEEFIQRQLAIHAKTPMMHTNEDSEQEQTEMTIDEVREEASLWYDNFVEKNRK